nr:hypothetical protein OG409_34360 [Streptomyces sp. NBC_00974]
MNSSPNISHDAVLRARVALLGSGTLPVKEEVAAYRILVHVSPLAYLPRLAVALWEYGRQFADQPQTVLALYVESVDAARRMCAMEPERADLLVDALLAYREQLLHLDLTADMAAVDAEIARAEGSPPRA